MLWFIGMRFQFCRGRGLGRVSTHPAAGSPINCQVHLYRTHTSPDAEDDEHNGRDSVRLARPGGTPELLYKGMRLFAFGTCDRLPAVVRHSLNVCMFSANHGPHYLACTLSRALPLPWKRVYCSRIPLGVGEKSFAVFHDEGGIIVLIENSRLAVHRTPHSKPSDK